MIVIVAIVVPLFLLLIVEHHPVMVVIIVRVRGGIGRGGCGSGRCECVVVIRLWWWRWSGCYVLIRIVVDGGFPATRIHVAGVTRIRDWSALRVIVIDRRPIRRMLGEFGYARNSDPFARYAIVDVEIIGPLRQGDGRWRRTRMGAGW